jgi:hypothetical protein
MPLPSAAPVCKKVAVALWGEKMATQLGLTRFALIKRIVMPSNRPFGEFIGAGVGLVGDLGNFLTDNITAPQLMLQISRPTVERNVQSYERLSRGGKFFQ